MNMKSCVVPNCNSNNINRPELSFFSLPKIKSVKQEWFEKLGPNLPPAQFVYVCELHFKLKDFSIGPKKELKCHAVPLLKLGRGASDPVDSEDEFMDQEFVSEFKTEQPKLIKTIKEEPLSDEECSLQLNPNSSGSPGPATCQSGPAVTRRPLDRMAKTGQNYQQKKRLKNENYVIVKKETATQKKRRLAKQRKYYQERKWINSLTNKASSSNRNRKSQSKKTITKSSTQKDLQVKSESVPNLQPNQEHRNRAYNNFNEVINTFGDRVCETYNSGRRPSRRAAIAAAQKISTIARTAPEIPEEKICIGRVGTITRTTYGAPRLITSAPPVTPTLSARAAMPAPSVTPAPLADISLDMECYEEALSETQTEILSEAQNHYNLVMKGLKDLVQCSGKMVQTDSSGTMVLNTLPFPTLPAPSIPPLNPIQPNALFIKDANSKMIPISFAGNAKPSYIFM